MQNVHHVSCSKNGTVSVTDYLSTVLVDIVIERSYNSIVLLAKSVYCDVL